MIHRTWFKHGFQTAIAEDSKMHSNKPSQWIIVYISGVAWNSYGSEKDDLVMGLIIVTLRSLLIRMKWSSTRAKCLLTNLLSMKRASHRLHVNLNRIRDLVGNLQSISSHSSRGKGGHSFESKTRETYGFLIFLNMYELMISYLKKCCHLIYKDFFFQKWSNNVLK